jgi:hypothetical protein
MLKVLIISGADPKKNIVFDDCNWSSIGTGNQARSVNDY